MPYDEPANEAAWNPAFMPNSFANQPAASAPVALAAPSVPSASASAALSHGAAVSAASEDDAAIDAWTTEAAETADDVTTGAGSTMTPSKGDDDDAVDAWLGEDEQSLQPDDVVAEAETLETHTETHVQHAESTHVSERAEMSEIAESSEAVLETATAPATDSPVAYSPPADSANKHYSTMSFTRTVSNDVNWDAEDDDGDWSIARTDTDPFKFMAPSDRSNSFPAVPPAPDSQSYSPTSTDAAAAAMTAIPEAELEESQELPAANATNATSSAHAEDADLVSPGIPESFVGGNVIPVASAEDLGMRFEEGVPLMAHHEAAVQPERFVADPFGGDAGDDDFFCDNVGPIVFPDSLESPPVPGLERKSTMQVLQAMDHSSLATSELAVTPEEPEFFSHSPAEPEATTPVPETRTPEPAAEQESHAKTNGEPNDLAAQWAAALADDDDEELLLDDSVLEPDSKEIDPSGFFSDDGEGFLDDSDETPPVPASVPSATLPALPNAAPAPSTNNRYVPDSAQKAQTQAHQPPPQPAPNPYLPSATFAPVQPGQPAPPVYGMATNSLVPPPPPASAPKAQSFADKSKGGYHSPYDLPMDVVRPKKRPSMQYLPRVADATSAPSGPPSGPPLSRGNSLPPAGQRPSSSASATPTHPLAHESFFEDLPTVAKPRPASRHSQPSPAPLNPYAAPPTHVSQPPPPPPPSSSHSYAPPPTAPTKLPMSVPPPSHYAPAPAPAPPQAPQAPQAHHGQPAEETSHGGPDIARLVAPPRVNPYAALQSNLSLPNGAPATSSRYSPSPNQPHANGNAIAQSNRYSPAPPNRVPSGGYAPVTPGMTPPMLPHQPRTSSPLAHFEMSYDKQRSGPPHSHPTIRGEGHIPERRSSSSTYDSRLNRVPSLPPTREVLEEDDSQPRPYSSDVQMGSSLPTQSHVHQYSPLKSRHTPPPSSSSAYAPAPQSTLSPPKRALNYTPQSETNGAAVPARTLTQSPTSLYTNHAGSAKAAHASAAATTTSTTATSTVVLPTRPRAPSQTFSLVPPTDGTETDPLQRWKGAPVFAWGVGGTFVSSFPQDIPRYGTSQPVPMIHRGPGEVQIKSIKEVQPLEERLVKFPGPLKGKSKKRDVLAWLSAGIDSLERSLPPSAFPLQVSHDDKRLEERILLWKMLRVFVEHDGVLEGTPAVEKAAHECLWPTTDADAPKDQELSALSPLGPTGVPLGFTDGAAASTPAGQSLVSSDAVDSTVVEQIRKNLLVGNKEKAAWDAVDKRLWGHALLIAGAASPDLLKQVAHEFVRKEVNTPGLNNESLAVLYAVLSGNYEECVDELVPVHARAGLQLMPTKQQQQQQYPGAMGMGATEPQAQDVLAGLDKWRESLCLILSNRSANDVQAIHSLGNLLSGYGRAEAAHVCFLFSRSVSVFAGLDDPKANVVLVGADHRRQTDSFAKETDAVLLSEVYEYGLSLAGAAAGTAGSPHLAAYKLQHALVLAEYGFRDKALQYCEAIVSAISVQTRRSPYHHVLLESAVEDLMKRLRQAPKEESNSWIPKPSMNKVSDTMWNRFNKFVSGDENEQGAAGAEGEGANGGVGESGPFARIAGGTPTISRPPSSAGMDMFSPGMMGPMSSQLSPGYAPQSALTASAMPLNGSAVAGTAPLPVPTRAGSRYAPAASAASAIPTTPSVTSPYEPMMPERRSLEQPTMDTGSRRTSGELYGGSYMASPGRSESSRGGLSRKSSYAPLSQQPPEPPLSRQLSYGTPPSAGAYVPLQPPPSRGSMYTPASAPAIATPQEPSENSGNSEKSDKSVQSMSKEPMESSGQAAAATGYQQPSYGYEPPMYNSPYAEPLGEQGEGPSAHALEPSETNHANGSSGGGGGYEPPSYEPYSYEPPSFEAGPSEEAERSEEAAPKKKSFMDDDEDDIPALKKPAEKTREELDRENAEMFRKAAEEDAKRAEEEKAAKAKKGWGLTSWFGGKKEPGSMEQPKAVRANLGEKSSFYFDPELKRWVNKNASPEEQAGQTAAPPPPPRSNSQMSMRSVSGTPSMASFPPMPSVPPMGTPSMGTPSSMGPPPLPHTRSLGPSPSVPNLAAAAAMAAAGEGGPGERPPMMRSVSGMALSHERPPSRPATAVSEANSIDDLLAATPGPRKGGKKGRKSGRYVDVMAK